MTPAEADRAAVRRVQEAVAAVADAEREYRAACLERVTLLDVLPATEVPCPTCGASVGAWCWRRPPLQPPHGISRTPCPQRHPDQGALMAPALQQYFDSEQRGTTGA